jgi:hypothetical protein
MLICSAMLVPLAVLAFWSYFGIISFHPAWHGWKLEFNPFSAYSRERRKTLWISTQNLNLRQIVNDSGIRIAIKSIHASPFSILQRFRKYSENEYVNVITKPFADGTD